MSVLNSEMKRLVERQKLGFVATVCPDGTPNLSPKGTTAVWDDDHLVFADIHSPGSVSNLRHNPAVEINVVDPILRKGYRFKGIARVLGDGALFDEILASFRKCGVSSPIKHIVVIQVERALPLVSPAYDSGATEEEVRGRWQDYWRSMERGDSTPPVGRFGAHTVNKVSLTEKFALIHEHWRPKVIAELNGQELKLAKFSGVFPWHHHEHEDELFLVWRGRMVIEFRDRRVLLEPGELCVVPRGVEHRTMADDEAEVLVFEPAATRNTGNVVDEVFTAPNGVPI